MHKKLPMVKPNKQVMSVACLMALVGIALWGAVGLVGCSMALANSPEDVRPEDHLLIVNDCMLTEAQKAEIAAAEEAERLAEEQARIEAEEQARIEAEQRAAEEAQAAAEAAAEEARIEAELERDSFIGEWAPRLNRYLSGSALAGYGETFAAAAYDYGIDPRYSAAISCIESGKGAHCFKAHNAWGWGSSSWSTWDEAIYAHAKGLAAGYGYTVSQSAAQKYCPPNWSEWYYGVSGEMSRI